MCLNSSVNDVFENKKNEENEDPEDTEGRASRLWVDRFSPRHYTELLSDDVSDVSLKLTVHMNMYEEMKFTTFALHEKNLNFLSYEWGNDQRRHTGLPQNCTALVLVHLFLRLQARVYFWLIPL